MYTPFIFHDDIGQQFLIVLIDNLDAKERNFLRNPEGSVLCSSYNCVCSTFMRKSSSKIVYTSKTIMKMRFYLNWFFAINTHAPTTFLGDSVILLGTGLLIRISSLQYPNRDPPKRIRESMVSALFCPLILFMICFESFYEKR